MSDLPPDFREKAFELVADVREKALCALIRALLEKGHDINSLVDLAETDLRSNFKEGHAITVLNEIKDAQGLVGGWFRKIDPALDDPAASEVKAWPRR